MCCFWCTEESLGDFLTQKTHDQVCTAESALWQEQGWGSVGRGGADRPEKSTVLDGRLSGTPIGSRTRSPPPEGQYRPLRGSGATQSRGPTSARQFRTRSWNRQKCTAGAFILDEGPEQGTSTSNMPRSSALQVAHASFQERRAGRPTEGTRQRAKCGKPGAAILAGPDQLETRGAVRVASLASSQRH